MKKILASIILVFFVHFILSCNIVSNYVVSIKEINSPEELIKDAYLVNGDAVHFNEQGGRYHLQLESIRGYSTLGSPIIVPIDSINQIRLNVFQSKDTSNIYNHRIYEVTDFNGTVYFFNNGGGYYDNDDKIISGTLSNGNFVSLPVKNLKQEFIVEQPEFISVNEYKSHNNSYPPVKQIITNNYKKITFDEIGGHYSAPESYILGFDSTNNIVELNTNDVLYVSIERNDIAASIFATLGISILSVIVFLGIAVALKESCPFIYSFDGQKYIFDAEPLGGATSEILQRTEFSKLDYLKPVDNKYKLLIRNEVEETQFIDQMELVLIDHSPSEKIYPDINGDLYKVANSYNVVSAIDENGIDITNFFKVDNELRWQTKMPRDYELIKDKIRHTLSFKLPKPKNAAKANLIINAGTTLWGSNMIREMLEMRGSDINEWYEMVNTNDLALQSMMSFLQREELYQLKLYIKEKNGWNQRGIINGGGPLVSETRIIPLDLSNVEGDTLELQVNPPIGFWTLDYLAADYDLNKVDHIQIERIIYSQNNKQEETVNSLLDIDKTYYTMPEKGDYCNVEFNAPKLQEGKQRTIFLKTNGYYKIHLDEKKKPNYEIINRIVNTEGEIIKYASKKYYEWLDNIYSISKM